ncbi:MAG: hypothetical protein KC478_14500, partial [Bacteriovoracaceae bacterium]|nr:hypothetical protein [Bacteriovoracaceae bacterium]
GHRFLKLKELEKASSSETVVKSKSEPQKFVPRPNNNGDILKAIKTQLNPSLYCVDHEDMIASGQCAISGESYCEHCLTKQKDIKVAKKYLDLYLDSDWTEVAMIANVEVSQDAVDRIVKVKRSLWQERSMPMIVQGHYKINVQTDAIEAFTVIIVRKDDSDYIQKEISFIA